ncbi:uncharacterized protein EDB93DRAFT_1340894 [Suillus bovinus]|uniref:uncharacterized protein n=1 Tax=Suillus bovinus TaxID=48563 RepID=UPI001B887039|nr:uncharacterized protein EDB93DRAFT_1340894 [Suillus bovinus]KAG2127932.1 hypothetical protein EDB93DRAFT_1340894 [Suillus bovinus]
MANSNAGATPQKTPFRANTSFSTEAGIKSTPRAIYFVIASEYVNTVGIQVDTVRPWIGRDVHKFERFKTDAVLQGLHARCTGFKQISEPELIFSGEVMAKDMRIDLELDLKFDKCTTRIGNVTTVFLVRSKALLGLQLDPHCEPYWPGDKHQNEPVPVTLDKVCKIAQIDPDASGHTPVFVWSHKFKGSSTYKVRILPGLKAVELVKPNSGHVLTIIVSRKLITITTLSGKEFLAAWWEVVKCHHAPWKIVHHRDVSPSNLMGYRLRGKFTAVLNDYDLSSFKRDGPTGLERTGTVPFMAVNLLTPRAIAGEVEHVYAHDAESFIWVLTWICLRYEGGKLLSKNRPLEEEWLKLDAFTCAEKKSHFWTVNFCDARPSESHKASWGLVKRCFSGIQSLYTLNGYCKLADQLAFELLLEGPMLEHDGQSSAK